MLACMLFAQKGPPPTSAAATAATAASHTTRLQPDPVRATSGIGATADNTADMNSTASSCLPQPALTSNTALPQHDHLSSQTPAAATASTPPEHEQASASSNEQAQTITQHPPPSLTHTTAHATSALADDNTSAEPGGCVAEAASMPATLSAQHGQNVALCGSLTCNELDAPRRSRLQSVLNAYLPAPLKRKVRYGIRAMRHLHC